jgi:predicted Ser/Thr protein kinase
MTAGQEREELLAAALAEYVDLCAREESVDPAAFCRLYPDLGADLLPQLDALGEIERLAAPPALPERLSGCRILGEIGAGGMGRVFLALDERLGRKVAIKTLSSRYAGDETLRARFLHEARATARLIHPNVARIYNLGPEDEPPHFVMEYVDGAPLTEAARSAAPRQKAELMRKAALAVAFLHERGILHRDLKPGNILVGLDLEPKLLDFGLALEAEGPRLTRAGEMAGTPEYFSPEQARAEALDPRSDVFSLGGILYELLTGALPFPAASPQEQLRRIREDDPVLPRRLNSEAPGELQNIAMKALEKNPADRYQSAREMAADLERYLAGERVLASPPAYARLMAGQVARHLDDIESWRRDRIVEDSEYDALRKPYERLAERDDAWILETRRLSLSQVSLYLGAWILVAGAALLALFHYPGLAGIRAVLGAALAAAPTLWFGLRCWRSDQRRTGIAFLLAFCLLWPIVLLVAMNQYGWFGAFTRGRHDLELLSGLSGARLVTNAQLWWAILLALPVYLWLRRFTGSTVFSLVLAVMIALLAGATLLRMGLIDWLSNDPGRPYFWLTPWAALLLAIGMTLERLGHGGDSGYFYPIAVGFTVAALSGVAAFHEPYATWLKEAAPWTRGQVEYLFILNAGAYFALQLACERFHLAQMRRVARSFRFLIPGHVMTSLLLLGLVASSRWDSAPADLARRLEARLFEVLLPAVACLFVFSSVPRQMKNFLVTGLVFLAIGVVRLQQDLFKDQAFWPISLLADGLILMFAAARYSSLKLALARWLGRR